MGEAIERVYVPRYLTTQAKAQINDMVAQILIAMKERIDRNQIQDIGQAFPLEG